MFVCMLKTMKLYILTCFVIINFYRTSVYTYEELAITCIICINNVIKGQTIHDPVYNKKKQIAHGFLVLGWVGFTVLLLRQLEWRF